MSGPVIGSLCSGYGGLDMAIRTVLGGELAWVADPDPGASAILAHHLPTVANLGDIRTVDWVEAGPVDVVAAGFPCQSVSLAGKGAGIVPGAASGLWVEVVRAVRELRPSLVVIENVQGLLSAKADRGDAAGVGPAAPDLDPATGRPSLFALSEPFWETWPASGSMRNGRACARPTSAPPTSATGSSSWPGLPTPGARDSRGRGFADGLPNVVALLPTPTVSEATGTGHTGRGGMNLRHSISLLPTPTAADGERTSATFARGNPTLAGAVTPTTTTGERTGARTARPSAGGKRPSASPHPGQLTIGDA
ncbi:DNA cytosine methyltransferase [Kitasatospora sp. NPDC048286]|uniref:DNA cytosine methyltransferase n=1 Tax=Kitasatospora sp. NPDC048286 TaxID=3364047 RepID=UPI0037231770